jgi:hypothetical protein
MKGKKSRMLGGGFPLSLLCPFFFRNFLGALWYVLSGQAWAEGKGELATCRLQTDRGRIADGNRTVCTSQ